MLTLQYRNPLDDIKTRIVCARENTISRRGPYARPNGRQMSSVDAR